jgi:hypothetical protein
VLAAQPTTRNRATTARFGANGHVSQCNREDVQ